MDGPAKPTPVKTPSEPYPAQLAPPLEQAVSYDNPAADPRKMRRIIAEDPEWTLATVPLLSELTMSNIITNFPQNPILKDVGKSLSRSCIHFNPFLFSFFSTSETKLNNIEP